jgi:hypothetical protein
VINYDDIGPPPGMPRVPSRRNPEPVTSPGTFRAAWERSEHEQRRRALRRQRTRAWMKRCVIVAVVGAVAYAAYAAYFTR